MLNATVHQPAALRSGFCPTSYVGPTYRPSVAQVKAKHVEAGGHFFDREVMREEGETLRSFRTVAHEGVVYLERKRDLRRWRFHPNTGRLVGSDN